MNLSQVFRDQIGRLSGALQSEFDQLIASIQTGWNVQHNADGSHANVTATTCACNQLKLRGFVELDVSSGSGGAPLAVPASMSFVSLITAGGTPFEVYGIQQVGQQPGDILYLRRSPTALSNIQLHDRATGAVTPLGTEIYIDSSVCPVGYPIFKIFGLAWTPLIYTPNAGTNNTAAWAIPQSVST